MRIQLRQGTRSDMPDPVPAFRRIEEIHAYTGYGEPAFAVPVGRSLEWPELKALARANA